MKERRVIAYQPMIQIRSNAILLYNQIQGDPTTKRNLLNYETYQGKTSGTSQKNIRKAVDILMQISPERIIWNPVSNRRMKHRLTFITLTIPGKEKHIEAKAGHKLLLEPWLRDMRRKQNLKSYIWKAEFQKNGQLHYHITTPEFITYYTIRDYWNYRLSECGLLEKWKIDHPTSLPNSTDVHSVRKLNNIKAYLIKYLSKNNQDKETKGKIWDCSKNIKGAKYFSFEELEQVFSKIDQSKLVVNDYCAILNTPNPLSYLTEDLKEKYRAYMNQIRGLKDPFSANNDIMKAPTIDYLKRFNDLVRIEEAKRSGKELAFLN